MNLMAHSKMSSGVVIVAILFSTMAILPSVGSSHMGKNPNVVSSAPTAQRLLPCNVGYNRQMKIIMTEVRIPTVP